MIREPFRAESKTLLGMFNVSGLCFSIPVYQRQYSWDTENIDQLMEDLTRNVETAQTDDLAIHFMGTLITLPKRIPRSNIESVIDGQQRISTMAMLAALLYQRLVELSEQIPEDDNLSDLRIEIERQTDTLLDVFSVDLGTRRDPKLEPIVIRKISDRWPTDNKAGRYESTVASYLHQVINSAFSKNENPSFPDYPDHDSRIKSILKCMNGWLDKVENAHQDSGNEDYIIAERLVKLSPWKKYQSCFEYFANNSTLLSNISAALQLLALADYLLHKCYFTIIYPVNERWAFDLFQSLNGTGTPLTAIETFKPLVVNKTETDGFDYEDSTAKEYFNMIEEFVAADDANKKEKLTNQLLTPFRTAYDGEKLPQKFSSQRQWLNDTYNSCQEHDQRVKFIQRLGHTARYLNDVLNEDYRSIAVLPALNKTKKVSIQEKQLATFLVLYLQDANHKMAHSILSKFYVNILNEESKSVEEFINATKATAAFFTLWRCARTNSGLDNVYRTILSGDSDIGFKALSWIGNQDDFSSQTLKKYYRYILGDSIRDIGSKEKWINRCMQYARYTNSARVARFCLFISAQDTMPDKNNLGLMKKSVNESSVKYLTPEMWRSRKYKTVEHVAPRTPPDGSEWSNDIYDEDNHELIGNLTLLPSRVNTSASNKNWKEKWIYYSYLAARSEDEKSKLSDEAENLQITLPSQTVERLWEAKHSHHLQPIVRLGSTGTWDRDFVRQRTHRICEIVWDRIHPWLED